MIKNVLPQIKPKAATMGQLRGVISGVVFTLEMLSDRLVLSLLGQCRVVVEPESVLNWLKIKIGRLGRRFIPNVRPLLLHGKGSRRLQGKSGYPEPEP